MSASSSRRESGQILILTALSMSVLLGIAALSIDASFMYDKRNRLHAAADAAAKSAALEVHRNPGVTLASLTAFANQQVVAHGFNPATITSVVVHHGPTSGAFTGNANYVEVIVSEPTSTFFGSVLGWFSMTPGARAVAGTSSGTSCLITLGDTSASPVSLSLGSSVLNFTGCGVADNGNLATTSPNALINGSIGITGSCSGRACPQADQQTGVPPTSDPLSGLAAPTVSGTCAPFNPLLTTITPGCYSSIILGNNASLTFSPGIYKLTGPFITSNHPTVRGTGVMLYLSGAAATGSCTSGAIAGCFNIGNNADFVMSAPTSGTYSGILFFQDPADHLNASFDGNSPTYNLSGAEYFPGADVSFRNGMNASNDCTLFIARSVLINNGNGSFRNTCSAYGGSPILTISIAE